MAEFRRLTIGNITLCALLAVLFAGLATAQIAGQLPYSSTAVTQTTEQPNPPSQAEGTGDLTEDFLPLLDGMMASGFDSIISIADVGSESCHCWCQGFEGWPPDPNPVNELTNQVVSQNNQWGLSPAGDEAEKNSHDDLSVALRDFGANPPVIARVVRVKLPRVGQYFLR